LTLKFFENWYFEVVLPYFRTINANKKVMIGDNFASHVSEEVIKSCAENGISFVLLPPNTTHLTQPLNVAFFKPLKLKWRDVLRSWKNKNISTLPKTQFPGLLKNVINELNINNNISTNLKSGFEACGIFPLDANKVIKRLPSIEKDNNDCTWINEFENILSERRFSKSSNHPTPKRKRLDVVSGKSITVFEDPDDRDPLQPELEIESPLVITIPASNEPVASSSQVNSMSTINMYDSHDDDDDENFKKKNLK